MRLPVPSNLQTLARVASIAGHDVAGQSLSRSECHPFVVPLTANGGLVSHCVVQLRRVLIVTLAGASVVARR